jgi:hypothetical protein
LSKQSENECRDPAHSENFWMQSSVGAKKVVVELRSFSASRTLGRSFVASDA